MKLMWKAIAAALNNTQHMQVCVVMATLFIEWLRQTHPCPTFLYSTLYKHSWSGICLYIKEGWVYSVYVYVAVWSQVTVETFSRKCQLRYILYSEKSNIIHRINLNNFCLSLTTSFVANNWKQIHGKIVIWWTEGSKSSISVTDDF